MLSRKEEHNEKVELSKSKWMVRRRDKIKMACRTCRLEEIVTRCSSIHREEYSIVPDECSIQMSSHQEEHAGSMTEGWKLCSVESVNEEVEKNVVVRDIVNELLENVNNDEIYYSEDEEENIPHGWKDKVWGKYNSDEDSD